MLKFKQLERTDGTAFLDPNMLANRVNKGRPMTTHSRSQGRRMALFERNHASYFWSNR